MPAGSEAMAASSARVVISLTQAQRTARWLSARNVVGFAPASAKSTTPFHESKNQPGLSAEAEMTALEPGAASPHTMVVPGSSAAMTRKLPFVVSDQAK